MYVLSEGVGTVPLLPYGTEADSERGKRQVRPCHPACQHRKVEEAGHVAIERQVMMALFTQYVASLDVSLP
jgi:hypothetical protein